MILKLKDILLETTSVLDEGIRDKGILKAIFLAGGPGSGKSKVVSDIFRVPSQTTFSPLGLKVVNSDFIFEKLLLKQNIDLKLSNLPDEKRKDIVGSHPTSIRSQAKRMQGDLLDRYIDERLGLIIDGTGGTYEKIETQKKVFENFGYDCMMIFVNTELDVALKRNQGRNRTLSPDVVQDIWLRSQNNLGKFQRLFKENFHIVDNTNSKMVDREVIRDVNTFINQPIKNKIGNDWISKQA